MRKVIPALLALAFVASGCAGSATGTKGAASPSPREGKFPVTIAASKGPVTIEQAPSHIISLSPTATEILFAIGAGSQVVAVDDKSNYPMQAPRTSLSGFQPNVEAIAAYKPDLVVISYDAGKLADSLAKLHIPVLLQDAAKNLDDAYTQITQLGDASGKVGGAADVVASMRRQVADIVASIPKASKPVTYYHELDNTFYTVTSKTFIGSVYGLLGLTNIADAADKAGTGYPQLSQEYILARNPDVIFLADAKCCKQSAATLAKRPGWGRLKAVTSGAVVLLDEDVASRWGPRIVDLLRVVADAVTRIEKSAA